MASRRLPSCVESLYLEHLRKPDADLFAAAISQVYVPATLERIVLSGSRIGRRAAVYALGLLGDYASNGVLGRALNDRDRGVRLLAETALRSVWCREGQTSQRRQLAGLIRHNSLHQYRHALADADRLIGRSPELAEAWNQRAIAHFGLQQYRSAIDDCRAAVDRNPYHFDAMAGMGQCYLRLGNDLGALKSFRLALGVNPELEGVRANVRMLERRLKRQSESEGGASA